MTKPGTPDRREVAYKTLITQTLIAVVVPLLVLLLVGIDQAFCALIGGFITVISNAYFAYQAFRYSGATAMKQHGLRAFYRGEAGKFIITIVLFIAAFKFIDLLHVAKNVSYMFLSFILAQAAFWFAPILLKGQTVEE